MRQDSQNRNEVDCKWRIPSEGIAEVLPHVGDGIVVDAGLGELRVLLEEQYPVVSAARPWGKCPILISL